MVIPVSMIARVASLGLLILPLKTRPHHLLTKIIRVSLVELTLSNSEKCWLFSPLQFSPRSSANSFLLKTTCLFTLGEKKIIKKGRRKYLTAGYTYPPVAKTRADGSDFSKRRGDHSQICHWFSQSVSESLALGCRRLFCC